MASMQTPGSTEIQRRTRATWAAGDYPKTSREVLSTLGQDIVAAAGIGEGQRVLDVAAGSGNAAIPAALRGADVVALDITPELFEAGRHEAEQAGVQIEWVEGDAQELPFEDAEFDVVMSCIGAMFAPDHGTTAKELLRVCRPGGTIAMLNWTPDGTIAQFFGVFAPYAPPPPGPVSPVMWGDETYVRELFADEVDGLEATEKHLVVEKFKSPHDVLDYYKAHFGPTIKTYEYVADDPEKVAALDRDFLEFAERSDRARPGEAQRFLWEYLLLVARRARQEKP